MALPPPAGFTPFKLSGVKAISTNISFEPSCSRERKQSIKPWMVPVFEGREWKMQEACEAVGWLQGVWSFPMVKFSNPNCRNQMCSTDSHTRPVCDPVGKGSSYNCCFLNSQDYMRSAPFFFLPRSSSLRLLLSRAAIRSWLALLGAEGFFSKLCQGLFLHLFLQLEGAHPPGAVGEAGERFPFSRGRRSAQARLKLSFFKNFTECKRNYSCLLLGGSYLNTPKGVKCYTYFMFNHIFSDTQPQPKA